MTTAALLIESVLNSKHTDAEHTSCGPDVQSPQQHHAGFGSLCVLCDVAQLRLVDETTGTSGDAAVRI